MVSLPLEDDAILGDPAYDGLDTAESLPPPLC